MASILDEFLGELTHDIQILYSLLSIVAKTNHRVLASLSVRLSASRTVLALEARWCRSETVSGVPSMSR